jgi:DNA invertase Pin-like site-specific DNA recombinase
MRADGSPVTGELEIVEEQAKVIRRIFADYARSLSPRAIARALNAEGVAGLSVVKSFETILGAG